MFPNTLNESLSDLKIQALYQFVKVLFFSDGNKISIFFFREINLPHCLRDPENFPKVVMLKK